MAGEIISDWNSRPISWRKLLKHSSFCGLVVPVLPLSFGMDGPKKKMKVEGERETDVPLETKEEAPLPPENHPAMFNAVVLNQIFRKLPFEDLKNVRQVHSAWDDAAGRVLPPKCKPLNFLGMFCGELGATDMERVTDLLEESSANFPCKSFGVSFDVVLTCEKKEEPPVRKFFRVIAPQATHLTLCYGVGIGCAVYPSPYFQADVAFPALKSVTVRFRTAWNDGFKGYLDTVCAVLKNAPNLETVTLDATYADEPTTSRFFQTMEDQSGFKVTHLQLCESLSDKHLRFIMDSSITRLTELSLHLYRGVVAGPEVLKEFLESQSSTLKTLVLDYGLQNQTCKLELPKLPHLTVLKICGFQVEAAGNRETPFLYLEKVSYLNKLPKLKCLSLRDAGVHNLRRFIRPDFPVVETVEELELSTSDPRIIPEIARMFPRVRKLAVPNWNHLLLALYRSSMTGVEELTLLEEHNCDPAEISLLGMEEQDADFVEHLRMYGPWLLLLAKSFKPPEFLNRLKVLTLVCSERATHPSWYLTDRACRLVLLNLENLRSLHFHCRRQNPHLHISDDVLRDMKEKFTVTFWKY